MTNMRMVYLLEGETQLHLIQLRGHLKLLSLLSSRRFRPNEHHSLPILLHHLSGCFASRQRSRPRPRPTPLALRQTGRQIGQRCVTRTWAASARALDKIES